MDTDYTAHWTPAPTLTPQGELAQNTSRTEMRFRTGQADRVGSGSSLQLPQRVCGDDHGARSGRRSGCRMFDEPMGQGVRMVRLRSDVAGVGWDVHLRLDVGQQILGFGLGGQPLPVGHPSHGRGDGC
jgi:hypothetical protein